MRTNRVPSYNDHHSSNDSGPAAEQNVTRSSRYVSFPTPGSLSPADPEECYTS